MIRNIRGDWEVIEDTALKGHVCREETLLIMAFLPT